MAGWRLPMNRAMPYGIYAAQKPYVLLSSEGKNSETDTRQQEPAAVAEKVMTDGMSMAELTLMLERHGYLIYEDMDETQIEKRFYREYNERNPEYAIHPMPHTAMVLAVRH